MKKYIVKILILCDPHYQHGFYGFLKAANDNGCICALGNNSVGFGVDLKASFSLLSRFIGRSALWLPSKKNILDLIIKEKIDWIHVIGEPTYYSVRQAVEAVKLADRTVQITCRTAQNMPFKIPYPFSENLNIARKFDVKVFPVSNLSEKFAQSFYKLSTVKVLSNGVPDEFFVDVDDKKHVERNRVLFVGHFIKRKGSDDFLQLSEALSNIKNLKFTVVGARMDLCDVDQLRKEYPNIEFVEWLNRKKLIQYFDQSLITVMPSKKSNGKDLPWIKRIYPVPWSEQFGRVIIESYARGVPVVAYDSGAINEVVYDSGCLVVENDTIDLFERVKNYIDLYRSVIPERHLINYAKKYQWEKVYQDFYKAKSILF